MSKLEITQNNFIDTLYQNNNAALSDLKTSKISKKSRIGIYQNNLFENLRTALELTYKNIFTTLGEKEFKKVAYDYIKENRSNSGNLDDYGANFKDFLENSFLRDLAHIDWIKQEIYLMKDESPIDIKALQKLKPEELFNVKFKLSKTAFLFESKYNLFAKKNRQEPRKNPCFYLIAREFLVSKAQKINKKEYQFLNAVKQNMTFYEIYEKYDCDIEKILQKYIASGILIDFNLGK